MLFNVYYFLNIQRVLPGPLSPPAGFTGSSKSESTDNWTVGLGVRGDIVFEVLGDVFIQRGGRYGNG